jgi:hypothetical protein
VLKKISIISFLFLIFVCNKTNAQSLRYSVALPYINLGAYTTKQLDPFSFTGNQAALARVKTGGVGIYGERRFLLADNSVYGISAAIPTKRKFWGTSKLYWHSKL